MIRVIYGEDEFSVDERVRQIQESIGPQEVRAPNTTILEGDSYSLEQLLAAASAVPFLADRRMVIVRGLLGRLDGDQQRPRRGGGTGRRRLPKGDWSRLANGLSALPSTTEVVFVDGRLRQNGPGLRAVGSGAEIETYGARRGADLARWISDRAQAAKAEASSSAISRLADVIGPNLRLLDQEIRKLALYAGERRIERADVDLMVAPAREANIFAAADAVLEKKTATAIRLLYQLLAEGASVQHILAMLARQVRAALLVQELSRGGVDNDEIARRTGLNPGYPLRKTLDQARRFPFEYLAETHRRLLEADVAFKSGADERLGVELLVARISGTR